MPDSIVISSLLSVIKSLSKHFQLSSPNHPSSRFLHLPFVVALAFAVRIIPFFIPFANLFDYTNASLGESVSYLKWVRAR